MTPNAAVPSVSGFGTRRVHRSTSALRSPIPATDSKTTISEGSSNGPPPHVVHDVADRSNCQNRDDRNQRHKNAVLEKILTFSSRTNRVIARKREPWSPPDGDSPE